MEEITPSDRMLEDLWGRFHERLCRFACSRLADEQDAEDILQTVFLRVHANLENLRDVNKLESWMYQITRNSIVDFYRGRRAFVDLEEFPAEENDPEEDSYSSLTSCIRDSIEMLPESYRIVLKLTEYEGISQVELAERLGISVSGAKSRVQRARQKVRDLLLTYCHYELETSGINIPPRHNCCCCNPST